jgi:hypothetical protein
MSALPRPADGPAAEQVLSLRKTPGGPGQQYEIKWRGQAETTWEAASRVKRQIPALVRAFESQQQQQQQREGIMNDADDAPMQPAAPGDDSEMRAQVAALMQIVQQQSQQMREQQQQLQQLRSSPLPSPQLSPQLAPQPAMQPQQAPLPAAAPNVAASAAAAAAPQSRFARKEPRAQDLREYDGAPGAKLEEWLQELARAVRLFQLNDREAVDFGVSRLTGAALQWSLALNAAQQAALGDAAALSTALRARFQPVTAARAAREQLRSLRQGSRPVNDYIAEFQRLRAQLPSMGEEDALFAFETGLNREIALELRIQRVQTVADAVSLAAHVGGVGAAGQASVRAAAANQMDINDGDGPSLDDRIQRAVLNAMQAQHGTGGGQGFGAKTQTQRGYAEERATGGRGGRQGGAGRGGRFGRSSGRDEPPRVPKVPGVPASVVEQRRAAGLCYRCGASDHTRFECANASSASLQGN